MDWDELIGRAESLYKRGESQRAYRLLLEHQDQLADVEDEDVRQRWEFHFGQLHVELGGDLDVLKENLSEQIPGRLAQVWTGALEQDEMPQG